MRKLLAVVLLSGLVCGQSSLATLYAPLSQSLEQLIKESTLIVKGTMRVVSRKTFYGYDENGNDVSLEERLNLHSQIDPRVLVSMGMPLVEYEIIIDEVLKGEVPGRVILRQMLPELTGYFDETQSAQRLFFLIPNHEKNDTYGTRGFDSILENVDGEYRFRGVEDNNGHTILRTPNWGISSDMQVEVFEQLVRQRVHNIR